MYIIRFRVKFASYRNFDELAKVTELFTKPKKEIVGIIFFCSFTGRGLFLVKHFSVGIEVVFAFVWPDFSNELTRAAQPWPRVNTSLQISNAWHEILVCTVSNRPKNLAMGQKSGYTWLSLTTTTLQFNVLNWAEWKYKKVVLPSRLTYKYTLV